MYLWEKNMKTRTAAEIHKLLVYLIVKNPLLSLLLFNVMMVFHWHGIHCTCVKFVI